MEKMNKVASEKDELVEVGDKVGEILKANKGLITGAFVMLLSENGRFLISHGNTGELRYNVEDSLRKVTNPQAYVGSMLSGEVRDSDGNVIVKAGGKGN